MTSGKLHLMRTALAALVVGMALSPARAAPNVERLLERAFLHPRSVAHVGVLEVTVAVPSPSSYSVRLSCDGRGRERREHLDGPARGLVVLTDGHTTWQRPAGAAQWAASPSAAAGAGTWERIRRNYEIQERGGARIAGRSTLAVALRPRHPGNPHQVLWIDPATSLILRSDSYSYAGNLAVRSAYTAFTRGTQKLAVPDAGATVPASPMGILEPCASRDEMLRRLGYPVSLPAQLPPGYVLAQCYVRGCRQSGLLPAVRYDDGLNALTLFVTRGPGAGGGRGRGRGWGWGWGRRRGGRGGCAIEQADGQQVARLTLNGLTYTLVGDHAPEGLAAALRSAE